MIKCANCGAEIFPGLSFCEECNASVPQNGKNETDLNLNSNMNQNFDPIASNSTHGQIDHTRVQQQPGVPKREGSKQGMIEVVQKKPRLFILKEFKDIFLAWSIVIIGFSSREIIFPRDPDFVIDIYLTFLKTTLFVVFIFGLWLIIDKISSRYYRIYTEYKFDNNRALLSFIASFLFIGIPPLHPKYRVWIKKPPKVQDIPKIQFLTFGSLLILGYSILIGFYYIFPPNNFSIESSLFSFFVYVPLILGLSIGINLLPFRGTPGWLIYTWNRVIYYAMAGLSIILFIFSFFMLRDLNYLF